MSKKYELTEEFICTPSGKKLYRIRALKDFGEVHMGELGGFVESEENLDHDGFAWVSCEGKVYDHARIVNDARVGAFGEVFGHAVVAGKAYVGGHSRVYEDAIVTGNAELRGETTVSGKALLNGHIQIAGKVHIGVDARIIGNMLIGGNLEIRGLGQIITHKEDER